MAFQYPLDFRLRDEATFERFVVGPNAELIGKLQQLAASKEHALIYIYGPSGCGKTHLLQGVTRLVPEAMYVPLDLIGELRPDIFDGLESRQLVCVDNIDCMSDNAEMEVALFSFMKGVKDQGHSVVLAAKTLPENSGFKLNDLMSRLNGCMLYQLHAPEEADIREFIRQDARQRGLDVGDDVVDWVLTHLPRDMKSLSDLMNRLDTESLRTQRRITIPFIKEFL